MKKLAIVIGIIALIFIGGFLWLLSGASAKHAPKETVTIDLPDTYER